MVRPLLARLEPGRLGHLALGAGRLPRLGRQLRPGPGNLEVLSESQTLSGEGDMGVVGRHLDCLPYCKDQHPGGIGPGVQSPGKRRAEIRGLYLSHFLGSKEPSAEQGGCNKYLECLSARNLVRQSSTTQQICVLSSIIKGRSTAGEAADTAGVAMVTHLVKENEVMSWGKVRKLGGESQLSAYAAHGTPAPGRGVSSC